MNTVIELTTSLIIGIILGITLSKYFYKSSKYTQFTLISVINGALYFVPKYILALRVFGILQMITLNCIVARHWHIDSVNFIYKWSSMLFDLWKYFLFGLVGLIISSIIVFPRGVLALGLIGASTPLKFAVVFAVLYFKNFLKKGILFFAFSLVSKATLQVVNAVQFKAMESSKENPDPQRLEYGLDIIAVGVISVSLFGLVSAFFSMLTGHYYLKRHDGATQRV